MVPPDSRGTRHRIASTAPWTREGGARTSTARSTSARGAPLGLGDGDDPGDALRGREVVRGGGEFEGGVRGGAVAPVGVDQLREDERPVGPEAEQRAQPDADQVPG